MHPMYPLPLFAGALLATGVSFAALAESPMPDPIPPAVIGRPIESVKPAPRAVRPKPAAPKVKAKAQLTAAPAAVASTERPARQAVDDRADPRMQLDDVGKGSHVMRKRLAPGAYFGDKHRAAVRKYYASHPAAGAPTPWEIGDPVPRGAKVAELPPALRASLPQVPPGHRYVQLGGEVVLIAAESKMVVDGISRTAR